MATAQALIVRADTATKLGGDVPGSVLVCGSHGGLYPGALVLEAGCRAVILHDAGVGKDRSGIGSLALLQQHGVPAATAGHLSARVGDVEDMWTRGRISHFNEAAAALGCVAGQPVAEAAERLRSAAPTRPVAFHVEEHRTLVAEYGAIKAWAVDSASQVDDRDIGMVVMTGSHGGLLGGDPAKALRARAALAAFNDAGVGIDNAGVGRLPALERIGVAAVTVSKESARIGDGLSTYRDGVISFVNETAERAGARAGMPLAELVEHFLKNSPMENSR